VVNILNRITNIPKAVCQNTGFTHDVKKILRENKCKPPVHTGNTFDKILYIDSHVSNWFYTKDSFNFCPAQTVTAERGCGFE
jgi:hypothetical protein